MSLQKRHDEWRFSFSLFGQSKDLVKAAIDRAYVDMASHTLVFQGFDKEEDKIKTKWKCRFDASQKIRTALEVYPMEKTSFDAQKFVNMTIKYLYMISEIDYEFDDEVKKIFKYIKANELSLHVPIDRFIIDAIWKNTDISLSKHINTKK